MVARVAKVIRLVKMVKKTVVSHPQNFSKKGLTPRFIGPALFKSTLNKRQLNTIPIMKVILHQTLLGEKVYELLGK